MKAHALSHSGVYDAFSEIDGRHSLQSAVPEGYILYQARTRPGGKVLFFNFPLAKEMGLIPRDHPHKITPGLSKALLEQFALVIINDFDIQNKIQFTPETIKPYRYMATRYLQLQHPDKRGLNSGDGRGIWNGEFRRNGVTWDISSSGTGATRLSPAVTLEKRFFKTGDPKVCYGNGYNYSDDGISTALLSEIFHRNGIATERTLTVIEFPDGSSVNVRAARSLLRPSHFFYHLKQNNWEGLKNSIEYWINRRIQNGEWNPPKEKRARYHYMCQQVAKDFAQATARFESDYIFCWLDWDGDNILCDGGIIDYGSIRQFGLYHHEYRYDDVERFSTKIPEQKAKARYIVQTFAQIREYLITGKKRNIHHFRTDPTLELFDQNFQRTLHESLLYKVGFTAEQREYLLKHHFSRVSEFKKHFSYFEKAKSSRGIYTTSDGITCDAIFCMRDALRELPQYFLSHPDQMMSTQELLEKIKSSYAKKKDLRIKPYRIEQGKRLQESYLDLVKKISRRFNHANIKKTLLQITMRSSVINRVDRITGDGVLNVTDQLLKDQKKLPSESFHHILEDLVRHQVLVPEQKRHARPQIELERKNKISQKIRSHLQIIRINRESC